MGLDYGVDISGSKRFPVLGYIEEKINRWCSIKSGLFLDHLEDYDLLNYAVIRAV
jgi:hypothetical protein